MNERLKLLRKALKLNQQEFAEKIHIDANRRREYNKTMICLMQAIKV